MSKKNARPFQRRRARRILRLRHQCSPRARATSRGIDVTRTLPAACRIVLPAPPVRNSLTRATRRAYDGRVPWEVLLMPRRWIAVVIASALFAPIARSQQEEPVLNKTLSEWLKILRTEKDVKWRRASLIALEVYGPKKAGVVPGLLEALEKDAEPNIRREVASTLGRMGPDGNGALAALAGAP